MLNASFDLWSTYSPHVLLSKQNYFQLPITVHPVPECGGKKSWDDHKSTWFPAQLGRLQKYTYKETVLVWKLDTKRGMDNQTNFVCNVETMQSCGYMQLVHMLLNNKESFLEQHNN